jgi:hypothetical protein
MPFFGKNIGIIGPCQIYRDFIGIKGNIRPFEGQDIPLSPTYGVYIFQLI